MKDIALIGFMGCGKSSVGRLLVDILPGYELIDLDEFIENVTCRSIPEIFREDGEEGFRQIEEAALDSIFMIDSDLGRQCILSLGGGTVTTAGCRRMLKEYSTCIYLKATVDTLEKNLSEFPGDRPMLQAGSSVRERIQELMGKRGDIYTECADYTVSIDGKSYEDVADEVAAICRSLSKSGRAR
ncbi:MAG: shikimate kinase [Candidatus Cryptobacteroides sp.]